VKPRLRKTDHPQKAKHLQDDTYKALTGVNLDEKTLKMLMEYCADPSDSKKIVKRK
jgi:hypothetical protein